MKAKVGDIIEILTSSGYAYAQYTHETPNNYGSVMRLFNGFFSERPEISTISVLPVRFTFLIPLSALVSKKLVKLIGWTEVRPDLLVFPVFRSGVVSIDSGRVETWWLWDGNTEWPIDAITPEQMNFPIVEIPSFPLLKERIENGWLPSHANV